MHCFCATAFNFSKICFRYGLSNCLFAATYDEILAKCSCVPFFHTMAWEDFPRICSGSALLCMNEILNDIGSHTHVTDEQGVKKPCYSPCIDQVSNFRDGFSSNKNQWLKSFVLHFSDKSLELN